MKRFVSLLFFLAGLALAADNYPFAGGAIVHLDAATKQVTVQTGTNTSHFIVTDQTYLLNGPEKLSFDQLKLGDPVKLNYYTNATGQALIRRLKIAHPTSDNMVDKAK
ncbi:MAG: hypothetical protein WCS70_12725 [Verrucomicrobiota bacterium]